MPVAMNLSHLLLQWFSYAFILSNQLSISTKYQPKSNDDKVIALRFLIQRKRRCILLHPLIHLTYFYLILRVFR